MLFRSNCDKARLVAVEQIKAYKLNVRNLIFISEAILEKTINYGSLLNEIFKSLQLSSSKEYIEDNFSSIVSNYIDENKSEKNYTNNEEILFKILNSDISDEHKFKYVEKNETVISKLTDLQNSSVTTKILDCLLRKNKIEFSHEQPGGGKSRSGGKAMFPAAVAAKSPAVQIFQIPGPGSAGKIMPRAVTHATR